MSDREDVLAELLREAHMRLMVSEGNARYITNTLHRYITTNVGLAERIEAVLAGDPLQRRADEIHRADRAQEANRP